MLAEVVEAEKLEDDAAEAPIPPEVVEAADKYCKDVDIEDEELTRPLAVEVEVKVAKGSTVGLVDVVGGDMMKSKGLRAYGSIVHTQMFASLRKRHHG
jgi:hypothetical protein